MGTALADPTRRRVLVHLIDRAGYPAEMAEEFGVTRANLSNHLTCLREYGLVTATAEGGRVRTTWLTSAWLMACAFSRPWTCLAAASDAT